MKKFLFAGMGGQGILSMGRFWTESGLIEGKEVSYLPAYGPEMRGGTANCAVIISRTPIASPLCTKPDVLIAMNAPSRILAGLHEKFAAKPNLIGIKEKAFRLGLAAADEGLKK